MLDLPDNIRKLAVYMNYINQLYGSRTHGFNSTKPKLILDMFLS
jgi:hypothetical protein